MCKFWWEDNLATFYEFIVQSDNVMRCYSPGYQTSILSIFSDKVIFANSFKNGSLLVLTEFQKFILPQNMKVSTKFWDMLKEIMDSTSHTYMNKWHNDLDCDLSDQLWHSIWSTGYKFSYAISLQGNFYKTVF